MTNTFSKLGLAVVTPNQQAKPVTKALVDRWFYIHGIPSRIHSNWGKMFDNDIIKQLCKIVQYKAVNNKAA